jgi:hypothetical protein
MIYETDTARKRPHDRGDPSNDTTESREPEGSGAALRVPAEIYARGPNLGGCLGLYQTEGAGLCRGALDLQCLGETHSYAWLAEHPYRFVFVFTPTHGSWLNLAETQFSKMTRSFLRGLRVGSKQELLSRIDQWLGEINAEPVIPCRAYQPEANA